MGPRGTRSLELSLAHRAPRAFQIVGHIHSWVFTLLQGVTEGHPSAASPFTRSALSSTVPLMGFSSLQRSPARRSRFTRRFHPPTPCVFRVRTLMTPCSPSGLLGISVQAALGIATFRASFLPEIRRSFEHVPSPPGRCSPRTPHASSDSDRTRSSSRWIRPREGPGEPSSGLYSLRESVPLHHLFKMRQRPMPSWFSSSSGPSPSWSAEQPSLLVRSRASPRPTPLRLSPATAPQRLARPESGVVSLETANPLEVLPLYPPVSSRVPAALGY